MELQSASPALIEAIRSASINEMPATTVRELRSDVIRQSANRSVERVVVEEVIVPDQRADLTPAQSVEKKLTAMLQGGAAIPVSHFRLAKLCRKG